MRRWRSRSIPPATEREALFLTRLALLLAHELGDIAAFRRAVKTALEDLDSPTRSAIV